MHIGLMDNGCLIEIAHTLPRINSILFTNENGMQCLSYFLKNLFVFYYVVN